MSDNPQGYDHEAVRRPIWREKPEEQPKVYTNEDTYQTIKEEFGQEVADLVEGVTKISVFENQAIADQDKKKFTKAENFRKLIIATSKDIRVLLVKIADRLHNMRTIKYLKDDNKKIRKAQETMEIYAPLADRMGMNLSLIHI